MDKDYLLLSGFPDEIDHYGLIFRKTITQDGLGNYLLRYDCHNFPNINGPEVGVQTMFPSKRQIDEFLFRFHSAVGEYLAKYVIAIESQREQKKPMFFDRS